MQLLPADYALMAVAAVAALIGLVRGLSGTIAFALASIAALFVASFGWPLSAQFTAVAWQRIGAVALATLVVFGLVRWISRCTVNKILSQPSDAIFGFLAGAAMGVLPLFAWAWSGMFLEYSCLAREVAGYVR